MGTMKISNFKDLKIWKSAVNITKEIYLYTSSGPILKDYSLKDQIRRATISISSNIAEGFERNNNNEFIQFLKIAKGSIGEVRGQIFTAQEIKYIDKNKFKELDSQLLLLSLQVGKFLSYLKKLKNIEEFPKQ